MRLPLEGMLLPKPIVPGRSGTTPANAVFTPTAIRCGVGQPPVRLRREHASPGNAGETRSLLARPNTTHWGKPSGRRTHHRRRFASTRDQGHPCGVLLSLRPEGTRDDFREERTARFDQARALIVGP